MGNEILSEKQLTAVLKRMAGDVLKKQPDVDSMVIVGMRTRGEFVARRIAEIIRKKTGRDLPVGVLDVSLYRDDFRVKLKQPRVQVTHIPCDIHDRDVILFDDVLYTGRTVRAALDELVDFGRPRTIRLGVLIDRELWEFPIRADYIGKAVPTTQDKEVRVRFKEVDGEDTVTLERVTQ